MIIPVDQITIGPRLREDMGDIQGLAESIKAHGLLHPIVVDEDWNLIAGQRRLEAVKLLGWAEIGATAIGDLTPKQKRLIELEENTKRKDLTPLERSKNITELAETAREVAKEETCAESTQVCRPARGPARQPGSYRDIEERTGIPQETIREAEKHVTTAEAYPFMQGDGWKRYHVLEAGETLEKIPEEDRPTITAIVSEPAVPPRKAIDLIRNYSGMKPAERKEITRLYQSNDYRDRALAKSKVVQNPPPPDPRLLDVLQAERILRRCVDLFPNDPLIPRFIEIINQVGDLKNAIREASKHEQTG